LISEEFPCIKELPFFKEAGRSCGNHWVELTLENLDFRYLLEKRLPNCILQPWESSTQGYKGVIGDNSQDADIVIARYVEQAAEALLNGKEIPLLGTRAIGCSLKA
jgi:hypothetical protein